MLLEIKFDKKAKRLGGEQESARNDSEANGKVGETTRGWNDTGERESGRNDSGANGKVGETTRIQRTRTKLYQPCMSPRVSVHSSACHPVY